jgi:hypothetical protein
LRRKLGALWFMNPPVKNETLQQPNCRCNAKSKSAKAVFMPKKIDGWTDHSR